MNILDVMPFTANLPTDSLSYFSGAAVPRGSLVTVPIRSRSVTGLVLASREARELKSEIRGSDFGVRKIKSVIGPSIFSERFLAAAEASARFFATSTGAVLDAVIPALLIKKHAEFSRIPALPEKRAIVSERFVLQRDFDERVGHYKNLVRSQFVRGMSTFIVVPTVKLLEELEGELKRGIESYVFALHADRPGKELLADMKRLLSEEHPVLIIGTAGFLSLPRPDIGTIVIEEESSGAYRTRARPYIDLRLFAEAYAREIGATLILSDTMLQLETLWRHEQGELLQFAPVKWRLTQTAPHAIIDGKRKEGEKWALLAEEFVEAVREISKARGRSFIHVVRKGLFPLTACDDCGTTLVCSRCDAPLVLHARSGEERIYLCHKCGLERSADARCAICGGWRLTPLGYGLDSVVKKLEEALPGAVIFKLDRDSVKTPKEARKIAADFEKQKGAILVGTEFALGYLSDKPALVGVVSLDSLFSIPSFRINERTFRLLLNLALTARDRIIIQTRLEEATLLRQALQGDILNFYRDEVRDRREFGYPPFRRIIKVTVEGKRDVVNALSQDLEQAFARYEPERFAAFISKIKNLYRVHLVMRIDRFAWCLPGSGERGAIDEHLLGLLRALPPQASVRIEPEDFL